MRVISGKARGTKLTTLSGTDVIRPTTDRVKESLFNIIQFNIADSEILDLFCGSGALGIEALSRNAAFCDFVDSNNASLTVAQKNLTSTHLSSNAKLHRLDYRSFIECCNKKYDLIFADPPYAAGYLNDLLSLVCNHRILKDDGILIFETSSDVDEYSTDAAELFRTSIYGKTKILFYRYRENST